jgi:hypothetical protein
MWKRKDVQIIKAISIVKIFIFLSYFERMEKHKNIRGLENMAG